MVVRELLVAVRYAQFVQPRHKSTRAVQEIELILLTAIDIERFQPAEIVGLLVECDYGILQPGDAIRRLLALEGNRAPVPAAYAWT